MSRTPDPQLSAADPTGGGELRLPRPPGVIRRFWARHTRAGDIVLAVLIGLIAASATFQLGGLTPRSPGLIAAALVLVVVGVSGVHLRRSRPVATVVLSCAPIAALVWVPAGAILAPAIFAVYAITAHRSIRAGSLSAAAAWLVACLAVALGERIGSATHRVQQAVDSAGNVYVTDPDTVLSFASGFGVMLALALAIGANVGNRRRYLAALIDRAQQLAVERDQQGQLATAAERARIAREMHDIVSHSLTVMVALAEGSSVAAGEDAPQAAAAMRTVADTGRAAMVDMRRMLGVLSDDSGAGTVPQPGFADLRDLVGRFRALKVPVVFSSDGTTPREPTVQLAVYRLVQESLTNALRYSEAPTEVLVTLARGAGGLTVTVTDDGLGGGARSKPAGSGRGLIGLRERVATVGGTMTAGPRTDGRGWRVQATIPLDDETEGGPA